MKITISTSGSTSAKAIKFVPTAKDKRDFDSDFRRLVNGVLGRYKEETLTPEDAATIVAYIKKKFNTGAYGDVFWEKEGTTKPEAKANWAKVRADLMQHFTAAKFKNGTYKPTN